MVIGHLCNVEPGKLLSNHLAWEYVDFLFRCNPYAGLYQIDFAANRLDLTWDIPLKLSYYARLGQRGWILLTKLPRSSSLFQFHSFDYQFFIAPIFLLKSTIGGYSDEDIKMRNCADRL